MSKPSISLTDLKVANPIFFSKKNMSFFGRQKFSIIIIDGKPVLKIQFFKYPRFTYYSIDDVTLKLLPYKEPDTNFKGSHLCK